MYEAETMQSKSAGIVKEEGVSKADVTEETIYHNQACMWDVVWGR
jgi:hypothetical protein